MVGEGAFTCLLCLWNIIYLHFEMFKDSLFICSHSLIFVSSLSISVLASMFRLLFSKLPNVLKDAVQAHSHFTYNVLL